MNFKAKKLIPPLLMLFSSLTWPSEGDFKVLLSPDSKEEQNTESEAGANSEPQVLLVPTGVINSSFSNTVDSTFVRQLRNAINAAQLQYKGEDGFVPITTAQTVERIQKYLAMTVNRHLSECGILNSVSESVNESDGFTSLPSKIDEYLYRIELGVTRLIVTKSLLSARLSGDAEASIWVNKNFEKKVSVNSYSFADKEMLLEHQGTEGVEKTAELRNATSRVVDRLGDRLGKRLCEYFN